MRKLVLKTKFSLGDVIMLTAAVRDLHRCCPGQFQTDVRTHFPEVWENNPHVSWLDEKAPEVEVLDCRYPLINQADYRPYHCLHGYVEFLHRKLDVPIGPTEFKGDIHLSAEEKAWASQVHELAGQDIPYWIVAAGGKHDITIKWWSTERYQRVIDHFRGRIVFVQVGESGHHHPKLSHTVDLRGQTSVRELIRLVYHAQGCLCSVTALMHLAAAVETKGALPNRPCVVVAGGREPPNWEAYPHHQFIHKVGALPCCHQGGCWKSRVLPLGDGDDRDKPANLCSAVVGGLPRCMDLIDAREVIDRIEDYFKGGAAQYLRPEQAQAAEEAIRASQSNPYDLHSLNRYNAAIVMDQAISRLPAYPGGFQGRGIVICGGGLRYFPCAWVCIRMLRHVGCQLPVEFWYQGSEEMDERMLGLIRQLNVECIDASALEPSYPRRVAGGWELKSYALLHSSFKEVLLLDADNVPIRDPAFLFEEPAYKTTGSIFWPDYGCLEPDRAIWSICALDYRKEAEFETGQMVVDKEISWRPLQLAFWFNDHSDFFFDHIHGDKETFHLAWRKLQQPYTMVPTPIESLDGIMCQHDLAGRRLFQHRNTHKWQIFEENKRVPGFVDEEICLSFLGELERKWDGKIHVRVDRPITENGFVLRGGTCDQMVFRDVCEKNEYELPERFDRNAVIIDVGAHIGSFSYACAARGARRIIAFEPERENFRLAQHNLAPFKDAVRVHQKAVWRSDRPTGVLLYSGYPQGDGVVNTGGGTVLVEGQDTPRHRPKELIHTIALDKVLQRYKSIRLLKLDCEGSEWPILLTAKLLGRVYAICGEFHEMQAIATLAQVDGFTRYTKKELAEFLESRYRNVRLQAHPGSPLGHFWAEDPILG